MSVWKRGNVYWSYVWQDGIRHAKSTGTANRRAAEQIDQKFAEELNLRHHQMPQLDPEMSFEKLYVRFLANGQPKPYHLDRGKPLLTFLGGVPIGQISRNTAREYRQARQREKPVSDATVNRDLACLRNILFWALDEKIIVSNPLSRARLVREPRKRRPVLSLPEEDLLRQAAAPHLRFIIDIALATGMRRGEILQQRWEDVDFPRRLLSVSHSKTPEGEAREIPLTETLFQLLSDNRQTEGVIVTFKGQPITRIKTAWRSALRRSGVRRCRFHDLRHTFATRLMEAGVNQECRKAILGHSSGESVHATYIHVELPLKRAAIRTLEAWMKANRDSGFANPDAPETISSLGHNDEGYANQKGELDGTI